MGAACKIQSGARPGYSNSTAHRLATLRVQKVLICDVAHPVSVAAWELKRSEPGGPGERTGSRVILVGIPESAKVRAIESHAGIVAPAVRSIALRAGTLFNERFALCGTWRITRGLPGIVNGRVVIMRATRTAITKSDVA